MARRNIFQPPAPPAEAASPETIEPRRSFPNTGAMSGVKTTLRDLSSNAVRDIAPNLIDVDGPKDRLEFNDADVAELAESIRKNGQQVPIMVRSTPGAPGRYKIVYGRRRLRALKMLGIPAKALVRALDDREAIVAQGQENNQRLDPSFVEKALFCAELSTAGYANDVILDALAIDKAMLSRMNKVTRSVPRALVEFIGPAHGIGRRRWEDLAVAVDGKESDVPALLDRITASGAQKSSDERFSLVANEFAGSGQSKERNAPPTLSVKIPEGKIIGEVQSSAKAVNIRINSPSEPEFAEWAKKNAQKALINLYNEWLANKRAH
ncbi:plasmid partitioning protein RepB [Paracoccus aestuariivivens]|uniref:Plasmid partitioning protein RepB n=1 Tax=Paracoccus aestuariivivens TaxID=1820333 RepID=A0A6L6JFG8_9RHOB|nr:plasmid partitioning protein RepB [Paracoccus aestuariivivens]MTH79908.1 plasmid partitioning protein RepB [Paracoccus aestuariivivens]